MHVTILELKVPSGKKVTLEILGWLKFDQRPTKVTTQKSGDYLPNENTEKRKQ